MARQYPTWTNFTAGAISPTLFGRTDLGKYYNAAKEITNFLVLRQGGLTKRAGTRYVASVKTHASKVRLVRFEFNVSQAYVLEFGDEYLRFYRNQGQIISGTPVEIATPYTAAQLFELQVAQSADTMWIVHPSHAPRKLTRTGHTSWTLSVYAPTANPFDAASKYPSCVTFFEERILFANTDSAPQQIWGSVAGDYEDFTLGVNDGDAFSYTIASGEVNEISWMVGANDLLLGTAGGEFRASGDGDKGITPTTITVHPQTTFGSAAIMPVRVDNAALFVQRSKRRVREFSYVFESDAYRAPDMMLLADHLTGAESNATAEKIVEINFQREPLPVLWAVLEDGRLLAMTYERAQDVVAWVEVRTGAETGFVESVTTIPVEGGYETWVAVRRTIGGATRRFVEFFDGNFDLKKSPELAFYVDSGLSYSGAATSTVSGLDHLIGETVAVLNDGAVEPRKVVSGSGGVTLEQAGSNVQIGLPFKARLVSLPVALGNVPSQGLIKGWGPVSVLVRDSGTFVFNGEPISLRKPSDPMDSPVPLKSGRIRLPVVGWDEDGILTLESDSPLPLNITSISGVLEVEQ